MKKQTFIFYSSLLLLFIVVSSCFRETQVKPQQQYYHTLQSTESLQDISKRYSIDLLKLQRVNEIYNPDDVAVGTRILIPGKNRKNANPVINGHNRSLTGKVASLSNSAPGAVFSNRSKADKQKSTFIWPSPGTISSGFGKRQGRMHRGIDITKDRGRAIIASNSGIVEFSGAKKGFGKTVIIDHGSGIKTLYAHTEKFFVSKGMRVKRGAIIAKMGSTGRSTGIHLHFEIRVNGKSSNPLRYLPIR